MRNHIYALIGCFVFALIVTGCGNSKLEKRVESLEKRVAQLENSSSSTPVKPTNVRSVNEVVNKDGKLPKFEFAESEYDFGTINEGDIVNHVFSFKNVGEAPLVIKNATASCGCTIPSWPKEPIAPGDEGEIHVKFNSKGKSNQQTKTISITANTNPTVNRLKIHGMVTPSGDKSNGPT